MKAKLIVNGKEFEVEIPEEEIEAMTKKKRAGYERVEKGKVFFRVLPDGMVIGDTDTHSELDDAYYENGNYYSDINVAENNARADKLMRQLRRFSVEHRKNKIMWEGGNANSSICFSHLKKSLVRFGILTIKLCQSTSTQKKPAKPPSKPFAMS